MSEAEESSTVPVSVAAPSEASAPQFANVLAYAPPSTRRVSPIWATIAMPMAYLYGVLTLAPAVVAVMMHLAMSDPNVVFIPLLFTSPLGIFALIVCVLGHYTPGGRRTAGPAMWIVSCTPGCVAAFCVIAVVLVTRDGVGKIAPFGGTIIGINALVVLLLNGRILKASEIERKHAHEA